MSNDVETGTTTLDRRSFVGLAALGASGLTMSAAAGPAFGASSAVPDIEGMIILNNLGGLSNPNLWLQREETPGGGIAKKGGAGSRHANLDARAISDAIASGTTAINITMGYVAGDPEPFEYSVADVASWNLAIQAHSDSLMKIWSAADIRRAKTDGKVGIIFGFQNAAMMGDNADRVDTFAGLGVKIIQLTYNVRNQLGDGSMEGENKGLTPFGREVVERLNAANTVVDLSHSGEQTCLDAIATSSRPICISHTGCRALADLPRNKTDEELRKLADKGGVVGIYFMPFLKEDSFPDPEDVVRHIEHAINVCGEDHVGIGTDGGTTAPDDLEAYREAITREVMARRKAGIGAAGEKPGVVPFVPGLHGPDQFRTLAGLMAARGHSSARIEKVLGGNFLRFYEDIWGG